MVRSQSVSEAATDVDRVVTAASEITMKKMIHFLILIPSRPVRLYEAF
jgi:hypothetical protein